MPNFLSKFWQELKRRKVIRAIAMYAGMAYVLIELANNVVVPLNLPDWTPRLVILIALVGFPVVVILSWIFDITPEGVDKTKSIEESGELEKSSPTSKRRLRLSDVIIIVLILLVGILAYPRIFGSDNLNYMTFPVTFVNEFGERETRRVFKEDYVTRLALYPFGNETTDSSLNWMGLGIMEAVFEDQRQFSNMLIYWAGISQLNEQITFARNGKYPYFLTGTYRVDGSIYEITTRLYQTSNGAVRNEQIFRGADFFNLVDSISSQVRRDLSISEIILETTPDLPISDLMTNHLGAYENYIRGKFWWQLHKDAYSNLNKAIKLDSTFAKACSQLAFYCFVYQASHISADKNINQAIRHRHRMSELSDIQTRMLHYMIKGDRESMISLSDYLVELRPWDFNLLVDLHNKYLILGLIDRAEEIGVKLNDLVPDHPPYQLLQANTYLLTGKPDKALEVLNELLAENPVHVYAMLILGQAFLHDNDLEAAEETFNKAILLMPEHEKRWSYFLTHISFIRDTDNMEEVLELFINTKKCEMGEFTDQVFLIQNQLYSKHKNQAGLFIYPISDSVSFTAFGNDFSKSSTIFSNQGKPIRTYSRQLSISDWDLLKLMIWWVEDSLILRAKDLLAEGLPQDALAAFTKAYEENPEHYYLANFIQHLQLVTSPEYETLKSGFTAYEGSYEILEFEIQQDQFFYRNHGGVIFELLPLSEDTFMVPSIYELTIHLVKEKGEVSGLKYLYRDGREEFFPRTHKEPLTQLIN